MDHIRSYEVPDLGDRETEETFPDSVEISHPQPIVVDPEIEEPNLIPAPRRSSRISHPPVRY